MSVWLAVIILLACFFFIMNDAQDVIARINKNVEEAVVVDEHGNCFPHVCIVCDHLLKADEDVRISAAMLKKKSNLLLAKGFANVKNPRLIQDYNFRRQVGGKPWMHEVLLSPRANYKKGKGKGRVASYSCCKSCKDSLLCGNIPEYAIANKHVYGELPDPLKKLNDVEWGLLTPIKSKGYGFTFIYQGGYMKKLKGVLSYQRIDEKDLAQAVMQLDALGLNGHVVVLFTGPMTHEQKLIAIGKTEIRVNVVVEALQWLSRNNQIWSHVKIDEIRERLSQLKPTVIDESEEVDGCASKEGNNIERTHTFAAYFPDGSMKPVFGGQATIDEFKEMVEKSQSRMCDIKFHCELMRTYVHDYQDDNFARLCMMQMPYGNGGMNEERYNEDGKVTAHLNLTEWVRHLSKIAMPRFHNPLFVLILQSVFQRQLLLKSARLKVRGEHTYSSIANYLNSDDVTEHAKARSMGCWDGTEPSKQLLDCVDAVTKRLPHTDGAATTARNEAECLVHHFGFPNYFLTFAPDDGHSHMLQVFAGVNIDDGTPVQSLSDEELSARWTKRQELRVTVPGLAAHAFEVALDTVMRDVVGVDPSSLEPLENGGHFGKVRATLVAVEEQGRHTLHAHILIWVEEVGNTMKAIQHNLTDSPDSAEVAKLKKDIINAYDCVATTELIGEADQALLDKMFTHECKCKNKHPSAAVKSPLNQQLRNLRHKAGCKETDYSFAYCSVCGKKFSHEDIVLKFVQSTLGENVLQKFPEPDTERLKAMYVEYQKRNSAPLAKAVMNAAYNTHLSGHTHTCWKKGNKNHGGTKRKRVDNVECRMRLPDMKRKKTRVNVVSDNAEWYKWTGERTKMSFIEVMPKRSSHDEFQNVSLRAISESKLTCNSNIKMLSVGPIVFYVTKYATKPNEKDDTEQYKAVSETIKKMLTEADSERMHDDDKKEAQRRVLRAAFQHNTQNVIGAPMAAWLTRRGTKYLFSHEFTWCPLHDMNSLLVNGAVEFTVKKDAGYLENAAFHYLCRNDSLENQCAFDFFSLNKVVPITRLNRDEVAPMASTYYFKHPSTNKMGLRAKQGTIERDKPVLLKIRQWEFFDAASLGGNILTEKENITEEMEKQARLILILFLPHRCNQDLLVGNSHTLRLQKAVANNEIQSKMLDQLNITPYDYLTNLQDCRANCTRNVNHLDELERETSAWVTQDDINLMDDDIEGEWVIPPPEVIEEFIESIDTMEEQSPNDKCNITSFDTSHLKLHSHNEAGYNFVTNGGSVPQEKFSIDTFIKTSMTYNCNISGEGTPHMKNTQERVIHSKQNIVKVVAEHRGTRHRTLPIFKDKKEIQLQEANGTARSIVDWAVKSKIDKDQRRTFEVLAATFVLTFYDEATVDVHKPLRNSEFTHEYKNLKRLSARGRGSPSLIAFVHGPGGSGKTAVIDIVKLYCEEFCNFLDHPFNNETIVVTAITGVAATLLLGETTDSALHLNKREVKPIHCAKWVDTRLLIIDEVSFCSPEKIARIDDNLRTLLQKPTARFGGMNVVFAGDLRQLKAVKQRSIIENPSPEFDKWVNFYIELKGLHRFVDDEQWGHILIRFRNGVPTLDDYIKINQRVVPDNRENDDLLPPDIKYAVHRNAERDAINTAVFEKHCAATALNNNGVATDSIMIFSDNIYVKVDGKGKRPLINKTYFWQGCGENDIKVGGTIGKEKESKSKDVGRVDPVLKLFFNCEVMLTRNEDVKAAKANGTRAIFKQVELKPNEQYFFVDIGGVKVPGIFASSVSSITLEHVNEDVLPRRFTVEPKKYHGIARFPNSKSAMASPNPHDRTDIPIELKQAPIISNTATTGHKLQGSGVDTLFVSEWFNEPSWIYVILSRVKTLQGLFLRKELKPDITLHKIPECLKRKIRHFQQKCTRPQLTDTEYEEICAPHTNEPKRHDA